MSKWEMVKLGSICDVITKGTTPTTIGFDFQNEGINFVKIECIDSTGNLILDKISHISEECNNKMKRSQLKKNDLLFSIAGAIGRTAIVTSNILPANTNQALAIIRLDKKSPFHKYVQYSLQSDIVFKQSENQKQGVAQLNLSLQNISDFLIPLPPLSIQQKITANLDKVTELINLRKKQIEKLDELVKCRFVEMFGNPETNNFHISVKPMTEICDIIDGDRGSNYPTQEEFSDEGYCLFLNAKNVTAKGFLFENCMFVTKEKDEALRKGHLKRGDVVLTTRGTIGNLAFYDKSVPFENVRINSGMVILRMNHDIVSEQFFIEQFKMRLFTIKDRIASGSAQPQLPISTMNKIIMLLPPLTLQTQFANFVQQVDKSKFVLQQSLDEAEILYKSLMHKYFN